jgi:hypothetical protein
MPGLAPESELKRYENSCDAGPRTDRLIDEGMKSLSLRKGSSFYFALRAAEPDAELRGGGVLVVPRLVLPPPSFCKSSSLCCVANF